VYIPLTKTVNMLYQGESICLMLYLNPSINADQTHC